MKIAIKCLLVCCMFIGTAIASENNQTSVNADTASNNMLAQMTTKERHEHMQTMRANHPNIKKMANKRAERKEKLRAEANKNIMERTKKFN